MTSRTKTIARLALVALSLSLSVGCANRVSLPPNSYDFIGFEDSRRGVLIVAEPYLSPSLNLRVFQTDLLAQGILPIQLSITNVGDQVLMTTADPQLRGPDGELWPPVPSRDVAKQVRRSATMNGLMARAPFLGLLAAPFGFILAPVIGGAAELVASHNTTEANHDMADDIIGLAFRPVAIAPGDTYRAYVFFHVPAPASTVGPFKQLGLTIPIEDASTRRKTQGTITIVPLALYTRVTIWDRPTAASMRGIKPSSSPGTAEVVLTGLSSRPTSSDASIHYGQAIAAAQEGQWDTATASLSQTVKVDRAHGEAFFGRGVLRARQGRFSDAADDFSHAVDLGFHLTDIYNYRAIVLARLERDEEARRDWDRAIGLSPNFPLPLYNRGMLSWVQRRTDAAKQDFETACGLGFDPACLSLNDLETHSACCPPQSLALAESKQDSSLNASP